MATAIELKKAGSVLDGFTLALYAESNSGVYSPIFEISSMLLGRMVDSMPSYGIRWSAFLAQMESFVSKDYIPVIEFPVGRNAADLAGDTISLVEDIIIRQTAMKGNVSTGLKYMVDECTDNILEHSRSEYGYISSRIDRVNGIVDICIGDTGIGILGSYAAKNDPDIKTNLEALQAANRGISTKNSMKTIDITTIAGPDLKSRLLVHDILIFLRNTGEESVTLDFSNVKFATRSFMDEFYNTFVKQDCEYKVSLVGMPEDIEYMLKVVGNTQNKPKQIESVGEVTYCTSIEELRQCLASI